ncbi:MAG TPA: phosphatase PAP2 family protein [Polyangiaceae bacterium]|nr:phosphatase PAP2 family protein [Polyangiaceae bacterium]
MAAALQPVLLAPTGADHELRVFSQRELGGEYDLEPVSVIAPFALAGGTLVGYGLSAAVGACEAERVHAALLQSMALSAGTVLLLKWVTGREFPSGRSDPHASERLEHPEYARRFEPFALRLTAWPSGHSAVFFASAASLRSVLPDAGAWRFLGYPFAVAVGAGMWFGDHHWASDILSGALLGEAIGGSVGRAFRADPGETDPALTSWAIIPVESGALLGWQGAW